MRSIHKLNQNVNGKFPEKFPRWKTEEETIKPQQSIKQRRINFPIYPKTNKQTWTNKKNKQDDKSETSIYLILKHGMYKTLYLPGRRIKQSLHHEEPQHLPNNFHQDDYHLQHHGDLHELHCLLPTSDGAYGGTRPIKDSSVCLATLSNKRLLEI